VTLAFPATYAAQGNWSWSPQFVAYWTSPGGMQLAVVVQHEFHPSITPVIFSATQLFGRHLALAVTAGGFDYSSTVTVLHGLVNVSTTAHPSLFTVVLNSLSGHSDLPGRL
jgi:hypothetical protein